MSGIRAAATGIMSRAEPRMIYEEILSAEKRLLDATAVGCRTGEAKIINLCKLFGSAETPIQDLTTPDGTSVWAGDGVHLTSPAYRVAARLLMAELEKSDHGETGEPATKQARLECGPGSFAAAGEAGGQTATATAKTGHAAALAVRPAATNAKIYQQRQRAGLKLRRFEIRRMAQR
jgi:hypothetical protein